LHDWGWNPWLEENWSGAQQHEDLARVTGVFGERCRVGFADGREAWAIPAGRARLEEAGANLPVVGDWVRLRPGGSPELSVIEEVAPRRTWLARKDPARPAGRQMLAANVDTVFLVTALNRELNPRRIERLLALVWDGGADPVILLNKIDLAAGAAPLDAAVAELEAAAPDVPVIPVGALHGERLAELSAHLGPGRTVVLLGSSGVGKSTLVNSLLGGALQEVRALSGMNDRGRHTTTAREMFRLPSGALLIDTPGIREVGLLGDVEGLKHVFGEIGRLGAGCRFRDCRHEQEPGCAVREAVKAGGLDAGRYAAYLKLLRESAHMAAEAGVIARQRRKSSDRSQTKRLRDRLKEKGYEG
jgi:ribosome biogenesis GTPase